MFEIIPCVDIQKGRAVRLFEGNPEKETIYFESPIKAAEHWVKLGAKCLHLVDLDAALGEGDNREIIYEIAKNLECDLEIGGGVRNLEVARTYLNVLDRVVIGTAAVKQPELIDTILGEFGPSSLIVSIDAKDGKVALKGWKEISEVDAVELAKRCEVQGLRRLIYTDISRDGTMRGVDPEPIKAMREAFPHTLMAGGGVASDKDLKLYEDLGLEGAVVGRALYEGVISYPRVT